ncbi:MAG: response regulator transcription factor [Dehalococcoidia bacterium]
MAPRVLVMEDDAKTAHLLEVYFRRAGYEVTVAYDGSQGIEAARRVRPDLAVVDLMMPFVDGLDVCRTLRGESEVAIIVVTARSGVRDSVLAFDLGADDYVRKPFAMAELIARARAVLRRKGVGSPDGDARSKLGRWKSTCARSRRASTGGRWRSLRRSCAS